MNREKFFWEAQGVQDEDLSFDELFGVLQGKTFFLRENSWKFMYFFFNF